MYSKVIQLYICIFLYFFHYVLLQDIKYSSLYWIVGPCCFSIFYMVVCIC